MSAEPYNPSNTKCGEETMEEWRHKAITGDLLEDHPPGCAEGTAKILKENGIESTFKLLGLFFTGHPSADTMEACQTFKNILHDYGTPAAWQDTLVTSVCEKVLAGFKCHIEMDPDRLTSSRMTEEKLEAFRKKAKSGGLSGCVAEDISGISEATAEKLKKFNVHSTWQLFGLCLASDDSNDFEATIKGCGVAGGWSATVVHQVVEALNVGVAIEFK